MAYDLIIKNGTIIDGTGAPSHVGDVAVSGDRIAAVGDVDGKAKRTIEADGHLVTPGFIDIHTHLDAQVFWDPIASSSCWHGVTSAVMGNCGVTFAPCKPGDRDYLARLMESVEDVPAKSINSGLSWNCEDPDAIDHPPHCRPLRLSEPHAVQNRTPFDSVVPAFRALRDLPMDEKLAKLRDPAHRAAMVEQALSATLPMDFDELYLMSRTDPRYDLDPTQTLSAYAARLGTSAPDAFIELSLAEDGMALFNYPFINPEMEAVERMLNDPNVVLGLGDSGAHCGVVMDAGLPTHFLTYWVRERGKFSIEEGIHKLTGEPASLYDLEGRGSLTAGSFADINVIDFDALKLRGVEYVHDPPAGAGRFIQEAQGYRHMLVNGQHFMQDGEHAGAFAGTVLRSR